MTRRAMLKASAATAAVALGAPSWAAVTMEPAQFAGGQATFGFAAGPARG